MVEQHQQWPIAVLCAVLEGSRSGLYTYVHRHTTARKAAAANALVARVTAIAAQTRYSYGSRRIAKHLHADGFAVGRYKARRLMQQAAVSVQRRPKRHPVTTDSRHRYRVAPNLLARQFDVAQPDQVWAGEIV
jgi:putative transposase